MKEIPEQSRFDPQYAEKVGFEVIEPLAKYYFRLQAFGLENLPDPRLDRPIIFVANHAEKKRKLDLRLFYKKLRKFPCSIRPKIKK